MSDKPASTPAAAPARPPMAMGRGPGMMGGAGGPAEKPKDFMGTMRSLLRYLGVFRIALVFMLLFAIASTVASIVTPKILGNVTNKVVTGYLDEKVYDQVTSHLPAGTRLPAGTTLGSLLAKLPADAKPSVPVDKLGVSTSLDLSQRPSIDYTGIWKLIMLLVGLGLLSALFTYIQNWIMAGISQQVSFNLRRDISTKIGRLPLRYFDTRTHGEVLSRVTNDVDTVSQTLNQSLTQIVSSVTTIIGILAMMLLISWQMTIVALLVLPLSLGFIQLIIGRSQKFFVQQQVSLGKLNGHVEEMFSGHAVMRAFNGEARSLQAFRVINTQLHEGAWKSQFFSGLLMPITTFVGNLGYVGVAVLGGWLASQGKLNIGDIQAFIQYMSQFTQPITQAANTASVLQSTAAAAERVFQFLGEEEEVAETTNPVTISPVKGAVQFNDVVFGYTPEKPVIKGLSAEAKPGQRIAIVGPTGAGKTTIVNLLMRFYDVDSGSITVDGVDIRDLKRASLRHMFGMVLQDAWLFSGTIEEVIAYGKAGATHKDVVKAAEAAHADHFIRALPGGYDMALNEEADNISQGEKQLLTIARAMLADAPILILDEATSSVDTRTETLIQAAMDRLMKGRTSFVIAHRLSTIRDADLILVMRDGNIVEQGRHEELLAKKGFYAELYNSQFSEALV